MKRGRRLRLLCLAAGAVAALGTMPAMGAELPDEFLENPVLEDDASSDEIDQIIEDYFKQLEAGELGPEEEISSKKITDPPLKMEGHKDGGIRYTLPNGNLFISSVPKGMVSTRPVELSLPQGAVGVVQKDGEPFAVPDSWTFTETGSYQVTLLMYQASAENSTDYNVYEVNFPFVIAGKQDKNLGAIPAPEGFKITGVRKNGRLEAADSDVCVFLKGDGGFEILYTDVETGSMHFQTSFVRDTTAPFLSFSQETNGEALIGPVNFTPSEQDCRVVMSYNGSKSYVMGDTLTAPGSYELAVEDRSGNRRACHLKIRQTYKLVDYRVIITALLVLAGTVARLLFLRRNMRVL